MLNYKNNDAKHQSAEANGVNDRFELRDQRCDDDNANGG